MPIEAATYISDLNPSFPTAGDPAGQGDDHLRLLKAVLQNTFPGLSAPGGLLPTGCVIDWYGSVATIPGGFGLCDGTTYDRADGTGTIVSPNCVNKFRLGAGGTFAPGATGGANSNSPSVTIADHVLSQAELPNYNLPITDVGHTHGIVDPGHIHLNAVGTGGFAYSGATGPLGGSSGSTVVTNISVGNMASAVTGVSVAVHTTGITVASGGSGTGHSHSATITDIPTIPAYVALVPIMKL